MDTGRQGLLVTLQGLGLAVLLCASPAGAFTFCLATCEGATVCFEETYHYRCQENMGRHRRVHVVIVSAVVCDGVDVDSGAAYHLVDGMHVTAWDVTGVGTEDYDQVNRLVLVGDRGDVLVVHQTIRLTASGPVVIQNQVQCHDPGSAWPP